MKYRAHKLTIREVNTKDEREFLDKHHLQKYCSSSYCYGLYDNENLIELMSFGIPRYSKKYDYELIRLCTRKGDVVHGGASKLLNHFRKHHIGSIISYCNRDMFSGNVYKLLGFRSMGIRKGYHYEKDGHSYHRSKFMKNKCLQIWPQYKNTNMTEREIMAEQGYTRVEDVIGQEVFVLGDDLLWYIYEIEINGYHYIGQHKYKNNTNDSYYGSGKILKRIRNKYNLLGNKIILLDNIQTQEMADKYETCAIATSRILWGNIKEGGKNINITNGGRGVHVYKTTGWHLTDEAKKKISIANTGKSHTPWNKGLKINKPSWNKGIPCSEKQKKQQSEKLKEYYKNHDNPMKGKTGAMKGKQHSDETKKKISKTRHKNLLPCHYEDAKIMRKCDYKRKYNVSDSVYRYCKNNIL